MSTTGNNTAGIIVSKNPNLSMDTSLKWPNPSTGMFPGKLSQPPIGIPGLSAPMFPLQQMQNMATIGLDHISKNKIVRINTGGHQFFLEYNDVMKMITITQVSGDRAFNFTLSYEVMTEIMDHIVMDKLAGESNGK